MSRQMNVNRVGPCPKCMIERPFIDQDQELERGQDYYFDCRNCGARVNVYLGPRALTVSEAHGASQRKLFE